MKEFVFGSIADWLRANLSVVGDFLAWRGSGVALVFVAGLLVLIVAGFIEGRKGPSVRKVSTEIVQPIAPLPASVRDDPDLAAFEVARSDRSKRLDGTAKRLAVEYVEKHPEIVKEFYGLPIEKIVRQVEDYRLRGETARRIRVDVWLMAKHPPQHNAKVRAYKAEVFPPGDFLREEIAARGWTQSDLAAILGRPARLVNEIIMGKRGITPETATGLAKALGTSAELWLRLDAAYQLSKED